jgi:hypothetical protein
MQCQLNMYCRCTYWHVFRAVLACRDTLAVQRFQENPRQAHELYLAFAVQRAVAERCNFEAAHSLKERMHHYSKIVHCQRASPLPGSGSILGLYGMVADLALIPNQAIAAAVSRRCRISSTVIIDKQEVAAEFEQQTSLSYSNAPYLALDTLQQVLTLFKRVAV